MVNNIENAKKKHCQLIYKAKTIQIAVRLLNRNHESLKIMG